MTLSIENSLPNMKDCNLPVKETKLSIKIAFDSLGQTDARPAHLGPEQDKGK